MATTTPPQPDEIDRIAGPQLEADLTEAGLEPPAARAIHRSLQFVVLHLLLVLASKTEVRQIVHDATDGLRREFQARFDAVDQRFKDQRREFQARFDAIDQRFRDLDQRLDDIYQLLRWNLLLTGALLTALIGLAIYDRIAG